MLITTIVMMLVLAVALTTSSLAWFSASQNNVTATGGSFTAATSTATGVNIAISDELASYRGSMSLATAPTGLKPMCLKEEPTSGHVYFNGALMNGPHFKADSVYIDDIDLTTATHEKLSTENYYYDTIYLVNLDQTNALKQISIKVSAEITQSASGKTTAIPVALLRVSRKTPAAGEWTAVGYQILVLNADGKYTIKDMSGFGSISDTTHDDLLTSSALANADTDVTGAVVDGKFEVTATFVFDTELADGLAINATEIAKIDVLMWYDGNGLKDSTSGTLTAFDLTISGEKVA